MKAGFGSADYLLYVDRKAVGAIEAKAQGTLAGVEVQTAGYAAGLLRTNCRRTAARCPSCSFEASAA